MGGDRISEWVSHRIGWFCVAGGGLPRVAVVGQERSVAVRESRRSTLKLSRLASDRTTGWASLRDSGQHDRSGGHCCRKCLLCKQLHCF